MPVVAVNDVVEQAMASSAADSPSRSKEPPQSTLKAAAPNPAAKKGTGGTTKFVPGAAKGLANQPPTFATLPVRLPPVKPEGIDPSATAANRVPSSALTEMFNQHVAKNNGAAIVYWMDAKELPCEVAHDPGSVVLFGRMPLNPGNGMPISWASCCVRVQNMERCVYVTPKSDSTALQVVGELNELCRRRNIHDKRTIKPVRRRYAFEEPGIPREESDWFKLKYPASAPPLFGSAEDEDFAAERFHHIDKLFGARRSLLELFLVKRRVMGPCYLRLQRRSPAVAGSIPAAVQPPVFRLVPSKERISHCAIEIAVSDPKAVNPAETTMIASLPVSPPLVAMSISLHSQLDASGSKNEIVAIAVTVERDVDVDGGSATAAAAKRRPHITTRVAARPPSDAHPLPLDASRLLREAGLHEQCPAAVGPLQVVPTESALLVWLLDEIRDHDPDVLVGHSFISFTLDVLLHRMATLLPTSNWSLLGRLVLRRFPRLQVGAGGTKESSYQEREVCAGRLIADTFLLSREYMKATSYKLLTIAREAQLCDATGKVLNEDVGEDASYVTLPTDKACSAVVVQLALARCIGSAFLSWQLAQCLDVLPLTKRLTNLAGNLWSRTLTGSRAERIEFLLLHQFHRLKFVTPDKKGFSVAASTTALDVARKRTRGAEDPDAEAAIDEDADPDAAAQTAAGGKYKGGMVLDPKTGLYKQFVFLLDFNSLYPSIIQEFNICFTTLSREMSGDLSTGAAAPIPSADMLVCTTCTMQRAGGSDLTTDVPCAHRCILPKVIRSLVDSRKAVKRLMKEETDPAMKQQLEIRQKAIKLTANSMYGCLGFEMSRFFAKPLAALVTQQGRRALELAVELVPQVNSHLQVIYGDTDSVMIATPFTGVENLRRVIEMAEQVKKEINKKYRCLEIDIDGVFQCLLLHRKKKYAALRVVDYTGAGTNLKHEVKGLEIVRRDWCQLSKTICQAILRVALDPTKTNDDVVEFTMSELDKIASLVRSRLLSLNLFVVTKSLTKDPMQYNEQAAANLPHVVIARRMLQRHEAVRVGDFIPYVVGSPVKAELKSEDLSTGGMGAAGDVADAAGPTTSNRPPARLADRAFHIDEARRMGDHGFALDVEWYLSNQILPPVMRLCEHIDGFTTEQALASLKLQSSLTTTRHTASHAALVGRREGDAADLGYRVCFPDRPLSDTFPLAEPFAVSCRCGHRNVLDPVARIKTFAASLRSATPPTPQRLYTCDRCHNGLPLAHIADCLMIATRRKISSFFACGGSPEEAERLRQQLSYYRAVFEEPIFLTGDERKALANLRVIVSQLPVGRARLMPPHGEESVDVTCVISMVEREKLQSATAQPAYHHIDLAFLEDARDFSRRVANNMEGEHFTDVAALFEHRGPTAATL